MTSIKNYLITGIGAVILALGILFGFGAMPHAQIAEAAAPPTAAPRAVPSDASCASVPSNQYCVAASMHGSMGGSPPDTSRYIIFHQGEKAGKINAFYFQDGTAVYTDPINLPAFYPGDYFNNYAEGNGLSQYFTGTVVFSSEVPFSLQVLNPGDPGCPDSAWEGLCDMKLYVTEGTTHYSLKNTGGLYPISQTHDIYIGGQFVARRHHEVAPQSIGVFDLPSPTPATPTPEGTPAATPSRAQRAASPGSGAKYEIHVYRAATATPTPTVTATPSTGTGRAYLPMILR